MWFLYISITYLCLFLSTNVAVTSASKASAFKLSEDVSAEILSHQDDANKIIDFLTKGKGKHQVYNRLATFVDTFGSRIAGSENLERAIDYMLEQFKNDELDNVHGENANVTHWVRGNESAEMILPRRHSMALLGLGGSVGTPPEGITAEVLVVKSFDELQNRSAEVSLMSD